jgi:signal transduction histidine kinase
MNLTVAVLLVILLLGAIVFLWIRLQQKSQQVNMLSARVEQLNQQAESQHTKESSGISTQEPYLQFIYNLSHEVANPLQSVQANLENMADCSPDEVGRWKQYYTIIHHEMRRLSTLTENLRLLSHLESANSPVKREPVNLKSVIEDVIMAQAERAEERNIHLNYLGPNRPARVLGNRNLLHEVIGNLVDNSIKYAKDSGGEVMIQLKEDAHSMHITIKDDGLGIPDEDLPFIFDTAYRSSSKLTSHRKGSGLGLAIVKRIVNQHEGSIHAESVVGEGTAITVDLPLYSPETMH